jgi:hypothetical protein
MKVIFLDVDGVLNSRPFLEEQLKSPDPIQFDGLCLHLIESICSAAAASIVVSSSWRCYPDSLAMVMDKVRPVPIGVTPDLFPPADPESYRIMRGLEVNSWLSAHPEVTSYAILDDNDEFLPHQRESFFKTSFESGLTPEIAAEVVKHLCSGKNSR